MKRKTLFDMVAAVLLTMMAGAMASCTSCGKGAPKAPTEQAANVAAHDYDGVVPDFTAGVAAIQSLHRQTMYALNGGDYEWRNSRVTLSEDITAESLSDLHIVDVTDVFQLFAPDPIVQLISTHAVKGTILPWPMHDLWIEDASLNDAEIRVTAEQALQRLAQWNGIFPAGSRTISLRLPVGPKKCNAQWVIGSVFQPLFVDAVTGEIKDSNPAF